MPRTCINTRIFRYHKENEWGPLNCNFPHKSNRLLLIKQEVKVGHMVNDRISLIDRLFL